MAIERRHLLERARPLADRVIVRLDPQPTHTEGGLVLPDVTVGNAERPQVGEVIAVGPGQRSLGVSAPASSSSTTGKSWAEDRVPLDVRKGDRVVFQAYAGAEVADRRYAGGHRFLILREEDILVVLPPGDES